MKSKPSDSSLALKMLPFGVVVLAEPDVSPAEMRRDLENIKALDFNTIVLYPSVSRWEGSPPGQIAFGAIDRIMDWCAELGLKVVLELQGQVMQDADAPEMFGYCQPPNYRESGFHDPKKRALLEGYLREVAGHFRGHPALLAYDLFNEIGINSRTPETIRAFTRFLERQYHGDIQELNRAWATYFANFAAIAEIPPDYRVWSWSSVVAERDWLRFRSLDFAEQIEEWRGIIREIDPETPLFVDVLGCEVLTNRCEDYFGVSDWDIVGETDVLGLSCYANMIAPDWWNKDAWLWPQFWRHARSVAGEKQVIISELMTSNRSMYPLEKSTMTDELGLWSYQAVFHGIQGMIYWKYRPFLRGRQVAGRGITDFEGNPNDAAREAAEVARFCGQHEARLMVSRPDDGGCVILHDPEAERLYAALGVGSSDGSPSSFYTDAHRGWFHAFWSRGISPSYTIPEMLIEGRMDSIRVLVIPALAGVSESLVDALCQFVRNGGILVAEGRFGLVDENGTLRRCAPGAGLVPETGIAEENFSSRFRDSIAFGGEDVVFEDDYFQNLALSGGVACLRRTEGGSPALVRAELGGGLYFHIPFLLGARISRGLGQPERDYFDLLFSEIAGSLSPALEVVGKDSLVDVSVLLDESGCPWLAGFCNFDKVSASVVFRDACHLLPLSKSGGIQIERESSGLVTVTLPPRFAGALPLGRSKE